MIKTIFIIFPILLLVFSNKHALGQGQSGTIKFNLVTSIDTTKIDVTDLKTIDYPFEVIIKHHLKKIKRHKWLLQNKNHCLIIVIDDINSDCLSKAEQENKYQRFVLNDYGFSSGYDISCRMRKKNSLLLTENNLFIKNKLFYYKYKNLDVIFMSNLDINFSHIIGTRTIDIIYENKQYEFCDNGKYTSSEVLNTTFKNLPKKYENLITNYKLLNHALYFVEYIDLIEQLN